MPRTTVTIAVVLPALLLGVALSWLGRTEPHVKSEAALGLEARLERAAPTVLLVGNSKARTDIDRAALAAGLGVEAGRIVALDVGGSTAPTWYAVLQNRVYANGHRPPLVVVYGPLTMALDTQARSAVQQMRLHEQLAAEEPVLGPKVFGRSGAPSLLARARERSTELHAELLDGLADVAAGRLGLDAAAADQGLERLFSGHAATAHRALPVVEAQGPLLTSTGVSVETSLLADFAALVAAHGGQLVFVRAPLSPADRADDQVSPATEREVVELLNERGVGWLDLAAGTWERQLFRDGLHLNEQGRAVLTRRLAEGLDALGALRGGDLRPSEPPLSPLSVVREGTPPALAPVTWSPIPNAPCGRKARVAPLEAIGDFALAQGGLGHASPLVAREGTRLLAAHAAPERIREDCDAGLRHLGAEVHVSSRTEPTLALSEELPLLTPGGDPVWWVYPGTRLRWTFPPMTSARVVEGSFRVWTGSSVSLAAGGKRLALSGEERGRIEVPATTEPWSIEVAAEGYATVERLAVAGATTSWLVGAEDAPVRLLAGRLDAPAPRAASAQATTEREGLRVLSVPGAEAVDDVATRERLGVADCSPVRLVRDGAVVGVPHRPLEELLRVGEGRYRHEGPALLLPPAHDELPAGPYAWTLDPDRKCGAGSWLYPGDRAQVAARAADLRTLGRGARRLVVEALPFPARPNGEASGLRLRLYGRDGLVLDQEVPAGPSGYTVDLPPRPMGVRAELDATGFVLLRALDLEGPVLAIVDG